MYAMTLQKISMIFVRKLVNNMGIKDETPEDKVIFDSIDNRMKYSKGIKVDPCACHDCVYKENNPYKEPCGTCLSPLNDKNFYIKEGSVLVNENDPFEANLIKGDIVKIESETDIKLNNILKELELIKYRLDVYFSGDDEETEDKCQTCKHKDDLPYGICTSCKFNPSGIYYYEKAEDIE